MKKTRCPERLDLESNLRYSIKDFQKPHGPAQGPFVQWRLPQNLLGPNRSNRQGFDAPTTIDEKCSSREPLPSNDDKY